jgi:outer membrane protein assembly factor BamD (BamD/ComL family)
MQSRPVLLGMAGVLALACAGCLSTDGTAESANPWAAPPTPQTPPTAGAPPVAQAPPTQPPQPVERTSWNPFQRNKPDPQVMTSWGEPAPGVSLSDVQSSLPTKSEDDDDREELKLPLGLDNLSPKKMQQNLKKMVGRGPDEKIARTELAEGERLFAAKQYGDAVAHFKRAAMRWPDSSIEEDSLFYLGECYFFLDRYPKANDSYANLIKKYGTSRHLDLVMRRQYAIARYWQDLDRAEPTYMPNLFDDKRPWWGTEGEALATYESVWLNDPTGPLADDSVMATANAHFVKGRYREADDFYDQLRTKHPQSEHQFEAHLLGLQSKLRAYQGPEYDGIELVDAEKLIDQTLTQFPDQLKEERERIVETRRLVQAQRAERDWNVGQHYDRLEYYRAAIFYYQGIIKDYPDTAFADMARNRINEVKDLPPMPPNRFEWLTNLFGKPTNQSNLTPSSSGPGF